MSCTYSSSCRVVSLHQTLCRDRPHCVKNRHVGCLLVAAPSRSFPWLPSSSTAVSCIDDITLHCPDCCPAGLSMTPFALAHLSVSWTGLTSLSLNVPAPGLAAAVGGADAVLQTAAGQLFASLGSLSPSLRHLSLLLTGAGAVTRTPRGIRTHGIGGPCCLGAEAGGSFPAQRTANPLCSCC